MQGTPKKQQQSASFKEKQHCQSNSYRKKTRNVIYSKQRSIFMQENSNLEVEKKDLLILDVRYANEIEQFLRAEYSMDNFENLVRQIKDDNILNQHHGIIGIHKILSVSDNPPFQAEVEADLVTRIIQFIKQEDYHQLQLQAVCALSYIIFGIRQQCQSIIDSEIPAFVDLLQSNNLKLVEQAIWIIGKISNESIWNRDKIIRAGGLKRLVQVVDKLTDQTVIKHCYSAILNLCIIRPLPKYDDVKQGIEFICRVVTNEIMTDKQMLGNLYWAISYHSNTKNKIHIIIDSGVVPKIINSLQENSINLAFPCIRILGNILKRGNIEYLLSFGLLKSIEKLLQHHQKLGKKAKKEVCQIVSRIASGNKFQVQELLKMEDMIKSLLNLFKIDQIEIKEQICWIFSNMAISGDPRQIFNFYKKTNIFRYYLNILSSDDKKAIKIALNCLFVILAHRQNPNDNSQMDNKRQIDKQFIKNILQDFMLTNKKQSDKANKNLMSNNTGIINFLKKQRQMGAFGKANTQISYLNKIPGNIDSLEKYFNRNSKLDKNFAVKALKYLKETRIYTNRQIDYSTNRDIVHLGENKYEYNLFSNAEFLLQTYQMSKLKEYLSSKDIIFHGSIYDIQIFAAAAILTDKYPQMIFRLFVLFKNPSHIYGVRLFIEGKWQTVALDLQFPIYNNLNFYGTQSNDKKIWPMLLQKAYSNVNGFYDNIQFVNDQQVMQVLTGAPSIYFLTNKDNIQQIIEDQCKQGSILTVSLASDKFSSEDLRGTGLVTGHSYNILGMQRFNTNIDSFIKLKDYCRRKNIIQKEKQSTNSEKQNQQSIKELGFKYKENDGSFLLIQKKFKFLFTFVKIYRIKETNSNTWMDIQSNNDKFTAIRIKISLKGRYSFTTFLKKRHLYSKNENYKYRCSWLFLIKKQCQKNKPVCCNCLLTYNNTLQNDGDLDEGEYIILVKVKWLHKGQQQYRLSSYGPKQVWMHPEPFYESYLNDFIQSGIQQVQKSIFNQNKQKKISQRIKFYPNFGYGFIQIKNQQIHPFDVKISFGNQQQIGQQQRHMTVLSPYKFPLHLQVTHGQTLTCKFIIIPKFNQSAIKFTYDYTEQTKNENVRINNIKRDIRQQHIAFIKDNEDHYAIAQLILNFFASQSGLIDRGIIKNILKDLMPKNQKERQQHQDIQLDEKEQITTMQQPLYIIEQPEQKVILGEASCQFSYIDRISGSIESLKKYFNYTSKLDRDFAILTINHLNNNLIYQDKSICCQMAINWIQLEKYNKDYCLFFNTEQNNTLQKNTLIKYLTANNIIKGQISDCYFLSAVAILVFKYPQLIFRLFVLFKNPSNIYGVRLFIEGTWQTVTLDLQFPVGKNRNFCGTRTNSLQIWPMLLEKAYAKVNGSYDNIYMYNYQQGIQALTGAPSLFYRVIEYKQTFSEIFEKQNKKGSIIIASIMPGQFSQYVLFMCGLIEDHCYNILEVFTLEKQNKQMITLIKLRNLWGRSNITWKGRWSIYSQEWNEQLRTKFNYQIYPVDGSFFMCYEDFQHFFTFFNAFQIQLNNTNSWLDLQCNNNKFACVRIKITQKGNYFFTTYLKERRKYIDELPYNHRWSWIFLLKKQETKYTPVCSTCLFKQNNTLNSENKLDVGQYLILVKIKWLHDLKQNYCLSSYGPAEVWMQTEQFQESYLNDFIKNPLYLINRGMKQFLESHQIKFIDKSNGTNIFKKLNFYPNDGYGWIQIGNQSTSTFEVQINFEQRQRNITVLQPYAIPLKLKLLPGNLTTLKFIITPQFKENAITFKYKQLDQDELKEQIIRIENQNFHIIQTFSLENKKFYQPIIQQYLQQQFKKSIIGYTIHQQIQINCHVQSPRQKIWKSKFQRNTKIILSKIKNFFCNRTITLKEHCHILLQNKNQLIELNDLQRIAKTCQINLSSLQIQNLYYDINKNSVGLIPFAQLQELINNVQNIIDQENIKIQINQQNRLSKSDKNIIEIIKIIIGDNQTPQIAVKINKIIEVLQYNNSKKQIIIDNIFKDKYEKLKKNVQYKQKTFDPEQQQRITQLNYNISSPIQENIKLLQLFYNWSCNMDAQFFRTSLEYLNSKKIYSEKCQILEERKFIHLGEKQITYYLFDRMEKSLKQKYRKTLAKLLDSTNIIKGKINDDSFFLAVSAIIVEHPSLIYRCFATLNNTSHIYGVNLFFKGKWQTIPLDLRFEINNNFQYIGAQPNYLKIWPMLLEKAYSKIMGGSYSSIQGRSIEQGFQVLTGAPSKQLTDFKNDQKIFQALKTQCKNGSILTCKGNFNQHLSQQIGLISNHSYVILEVLDSIKGLNSQSLTLIKLINPWKARQDDAYKQWKGLQKNLVNLLTKKAYNEMIGHRIRHDNGTFFLQKQAFFNYFNSIIITKVREQNKNSWQDIQNKNEEFIVVKVLVKEPGKYFFSTYLIDGLKDMQRYSWMFLLQKQSLRYKKIYSRCNKQSNNRIQSDFQVGEYLLILRMQLKIENQRYRLSSYGPEQVIMQKIQFKQTYLLNYLQIMEHGDSIDPQKKIFVKIKFYHAFGYGLIQIQNKQEYRYIFKIQFNGQQKDILILAPYNLPLIFNIHPGQTTSCMLIIKQNFRQKDLQWSINLA